MNFNAHIYCKGSLTCKVVWVAIVHVLDCSYDVKHQLNVKGIVDGKQK